jgi:hypothetical protein
VCDVTQFVLKWFYEWRGWTVVSFLIFASRTSDGWNCKKRKNGRRRTWYMRTSKFKSLCIACKTKKIILYNDLKEKQRFKIIQMQTKIQQTSCLLRHKKTNFARVSAGNFAALLFCKYTVTTYYMCAHNINY